MAAARQQPAQRRKRRRRARKRSGPDPALLLLSAAMLGGLIVVGLLLLMVRDDQKLIADRPLSPPTARTTAPDEAAANDELDPEGTDADVDLDLGRELDLASASESPTEGVMVGPMEGQDGSFSERMPDDARVTADLIRVSPDAEGLWLDLVIENRGSDRLRWFDGTLTLRDPAGETLGHAVVDFPTPIEAGTGRAYRLLVQAQGLDDLMASGASQHSASLSLGQYVWSNDDNPRGRPAEPLAPSLRVLMAQYDADGQGLFTTVPGVGTGLPVAQNDSFLRPDLPQDPTPTSSVDHSDFAIEQTMIDTDDPRGIWLGYQLTNQSGQDIKAVDGVAVYHDPEGIMMVRVLLVYDAPIADGASIRIDVMADRDEPTVRRIADAFASDATETSDQAIDAKPVSFDLSFHPRFVLNAQDVLEQHPVQAFIFPALTRYPKD